ncbi:MAG: pyrimidine-nucleoside phosphorylase [Clostridia bacterium]|nr:pyrimidine-nucleoside phosphorylase [Clostridia bacterium]MBT7121458.1 pyrimidine-nucleoside phosphorylase [Clostridia bacterium]
MRTVDIIAKKKNGESLSKPEIQFVIDGYVGGSIPDYQIAALLMAICFVGMNETETVALTIAMANSGDTVDLSPIPGVKVDKHSTGGVGDTTTLIAAPLVAACGVPIAKMSGRGLGHTGGTVDKLEAIPGVDLARDTDELLRIVKQTGIAVVGQSQNLVPADKLLYALRDVTSTVNSMPLIASSIMSKKLASGCDAIVLDVKTGNGAFMETKESAIALAKEMVAIGKGSGRETIAVITDMNQPLGMSIGNLIEVAEAVDALSGKLPLDTPLMSVSLTLAEHMLMLGGGARNNEQAREMLIGALKSGAAKDKLKHMIEALGGNTAFVDDPYSYIHVREKEELEAQSSGYISAVDTTKVGLAAGSLGAGRARKSDVIDPSVGFVLKKRVGDAVAKGESLATLYINDEMKGQTAASILLDSYQISDTKPEAIPLIYDIVK